MKPGRRCAGGSIDSTHPISWSGSSATSTYDGGRCVSGADTGRPAILVVDGGDFYLQFGQQGAAVLNIRISRVLAQASQRSRQQVARLAQTVLLDPEPRETT